MIDIPRTIWVELAPRSAEGKREGDRRSAHEANAPGPAGERPRRAGSEIELSKNRVRLTTCYAVAGHCRAARESGDRQSGPHGMLDVRSRSGLLTTQRSRKKKPRPLPQQSAAPDQFHQGQEVYNVWLQTKRSDRSDNLSCAARVTRKLLLMRKLWLNSGCLRRRRRMRFGKCAGPPAGSGVVAATPRAMRVYGDGPIARENSIHECCPAEINLFDNLTWSGYRAD